LQKLFNIPVENSILNLM